MVPLNPRGIVLQTTDACQDRRVRFSGKTRKALPDRILNLVYKPLPDGRTYKKTGLESGWETKPADARNSSVSRYENHEAKDYLQPGTFVGSHFGRHFKSLPKMQSRRPGFSQVPHSGFEQVWHGFAGAHGVEVQM